MKRNQAALRWSLRAALLAGSLCLCACWIPLPQETALVIEVLDEAGNTVGNVPVILDGQTFITPDSGDRRGQVYRSYSSASNHTVVIDTDGIADFQGGVPLVPRASMLSGETEAVSALRRPFFIWSPLVAPVEVGSVTKVTIFLADLYLSPKDNQWLTDGLDPTPLRVGNGSREFAAAPMPTFAWREDAALAGTTTGVVDFVFQLWEDPDADTRYPLGVVNASGYARTVLGATGGGSHPTDWEIPHHGLQRARAPRENNGRVFLWSAPAVDEVSGVTYDVYFAQSAYWTTTDPSWAKWNILGDVTTGTDGGATYIELGPSTANPVVFKAGVPYRFMLRARDAAGNLDSTVATATRVAVPNGGANLAWNGASATATADSLYGGRIDLFVPSTTPSDVGCYRVYVAPAADFAVNPFEERFWRATLPAWGSSTLTGLVNGLNYAIGIEPIDSAGNRPAAGGTVRLVRAAVNKGGPADSVAPVLPTSLGGNAVSVEQVGTGIVNLYFNAATDDSPVHYRVHVNAGESPSDWEATRFVEFDTVFPATGGDGQDSQVTVGNLVNGIPYYFLVAAIDEHGNRTRYQSSNVFRLAGVGDATGPVWASGDSSPLFTAVAWSHAGSTRRLGWKYDYDGFSLRKSPRLSGPGADGTGGEYVWRVVQESRDTPGQTLQGKLAAFYAYSSYYFNSPNSSDPSGGLHMSDFGQSAGVRHREVLGFLWRRLGVLRSGSEGSPAGTVGVMNAYLASQSGVASQYRQRLAGDLLDAQRLYSRASSVNHMAVFYNVNEDGKVVSSGGPGNRSTFIDVVLTNRAVTNPYGAPYYASQLPSAPPNLSSKRFHLTYNFDFSLLGSMDSLVVDPTAPTTGGIFFDGLPLTPDLSADGFPWQDPAW